MSIRIIVRTDNAGMACNVGGAVITNYKTFEISAPNVEKFMNEKLDTYSQRQIIGIEVLRETSENEALQ